MDGFMLADNVRRKYTSLPVLFMTGAVPENDERARRVHRLALGRNLRRFLAHAVALRPSEFKRKSGIKRSSLRATPHLFRFALELASASRWKGGCILLLLIAHSSLGLKIKNKRSPSRVLRFLTLSAAARSVAPRLQQDSNCRKNLCKSPFWVGVL
jgi:hypothetical protein